MSVVVGYALREALRRRVFLVVLLLTICFLGLYGLANYYIFRDVASIQVPEDVPVDSRTFAAAFVDGMAMFATLFLGVVLGVFLTLGAVGGDAERGLLQPLVVRPLGRGSLIVGRRALLEHFGIGLRGARTGTKLRTGADMVPWGAVVPGVFVFWA